MDIIRLTGEDCKKTRSLWERVFSEDSKKFVDYYYETKAADNLAYVIGAEPYEAMLFRTPYPVQIYGKLRSLSYIIGVATLPEMRHKGRMTALLMTAMEDMYRERLPFTFLMPASPAIYEPFDFSYVYERIQWRFAQGEFPKQVLEPLMGQHQGRECVPAPESVLFGGCTGLVLSSLRGKNRDEKRGWYRRLADYANGWLERRHHIYVKRDAQYYERQLKEIEAQNGDIFLVEKEEGLAGYFLYAREGEEMALQEVLEDEPGRFFFLREEEKKKPVIMARIIHLEEMLKLVKCPEEKSLLIQVEDPLLPWNEGIFRWELTPEGSRVTRLTENRVPEAVVGIGELATFLVKEVFLNEIV